MFRVELSYRYGLLPSELEERMLVSDYVLLVAAESLEPRGEQREDLRAGIVAAAVANPWRPKGRAPYKPADFMPKFDGNRRRQSPQEMKRLLGDYTRSLGGTVTEVRRGLN